MLVDDEVLVLRALHRTLRSLCRGADVQLEAFSDPAAALLRCGEVAFDVVISDYRMPGMNGADFLGFFRQLQPDAVRIVLSASTDYSEVSDAINRGEIFRYVPKPWDENELKSVLLLAFERFDQASATPGGREAEAAPPLPAGEPAPRGPGQDEPGATLVRRDLDGPAHLDRDAGDGGRPLRD